MFPQEAAVAKHFVALSTNGVSHIIYRLNLLSLSRHLTLTVLFFTPSAQSEGLRHRHRKHVRVLGRECSLKLKADRAQQALSSSTVCEGAVGSSYK